MSIVEVTDTLVAEHGAWLRRFVRRRMADPALVDDVVQEVLLRVCRGSPPEDPRQLRPWLATVALRTCADVWRAQPPRATALDPVHDGLPSAAAVVPGSDDHLAAVTQRADINDALVRLPVRHRRLFEKQALLGLTYEEIADEENVSVACVTSVLGRARAGFRRRYAEGGAPAGLALLHRLRARLQAPVGGHLAEWALTSVALVTTAVLVVGSESSASHAVAAVASAAPATTATGTVVGAPTRSMETRAVSPAGGRVPSRPSPSGPGPEAARRPVGEVAVDPPRLDLTPDRWEVGFAVEASGPHDVVSARAEVTLVCDGSRVMAAACPVASQAPGARS